MNDTTAGQARVYITELLKFLQHFHIVYGTDWQIILEPNSEFTLDETEHLVETLNSTLISLIKVSKELWS